MTLKESLKEIVWRSRNTQKSLCEKAGCKNVSTLTSSMQRGDMYVSSLVKFANAAGYSVMLVNEKALGTEPPVKIDFDKAD